MSSQSAPGPSGALAVYRFEGFTLDLAKGCLYNGSDQVKLRPKSFEALRYIVERSGRLVSKDELTSAVWPDSLVSDNSLAQCFLEIRKILQDDDQRIIRTVSRRGYIFSVPVERVLAHPVPSAADAPSPVPVPSSARHPTSRIRWLAGGAALLAIAMATAIWLDRSRPTPASAPVSMAVLPFQSLVQSEPDEFLELGLSDALIMRLSNLRELVVRPTSAVRDYTDRKRDPVAIGKLLKVSYVVDGSVQQKAGRIRVSIQLIGVPDGRPLWAERFDEASPGRSGGPVPGLQLRSRRGRL